MKNVASGPRAIAKTPAVEEASGNFDPTVRELAEELSRSRFITLDKLNDDLTAKTVVFVLYNDGSGDYTFYKRGDLRNIRSERDEYSSDPGQQQNFSTLRQALDYLSSYHQEGYRLTNIKKLLHIYRSRMYYNLRDPQYATKQIIRTITTYFTQLISLAKIGAHYTSLEIFIPYFLPGGRRMHTREFYRRADSYSQKYPTSNMEEILQNYFNTYRSDLISYLT